MRFRSLTLVTLVLAGGLLASPASAGSPAPTIWVYPSTAPCDTTLQACVNAAAAGDVVRVAADVPDLGILTISKSLTLEADPGVSPVPVLGTTSGNTRIDVDSEDPTDLVKVDVTIRNLRTRRVTIDAFYGKGSGSTFTVTGMQMRSIFDNNNQDSIGVTAYAPITVIVRDNVIHADGNPIELTPLPGAGGGDTTPGTFEGWVERNVLTSPPNDENNGLALDLRPAEGSTAHVRVYDNLVVEQGTCFCGGSAGINVSSVSPGAGGTSLADVWHNTVVRTARGGPGPSAGIDVYQNAGTSLRVNLFDNVVVDGRGEGISIGGTDSLPTVVSGFNDSWGNTRPDDWSGIAHPNHLSVDPRFVDAASGDYRLQASSPLIDAGVVCRAGGLGVLDVAGKQRMAGPMVDIGAYERGAVVDDPGVARMSGSGPSLMLGTEAQDFLCGFGGLDELEGYAGNDYLDGGKGAGDFLLGGPGADVLVTKDGQPDDHADGGKGVDLCRSDAGDVQVSC